MIKKKIYFCRFFQIKNKKLNINIIALIIFNVTIIQLIFIFIFYYIIRHIIYYLLHYDVDENGFPQ